MIRKSVVLVGVWLVIVNIFALLALNRLNIVPDTALEWMNPETYKPRKSWNIIDLHNRWDSYWYLDIAKNGYYLRSETPQANVVFFPLYPMLLWLVKPLAAGNLVLAGWIVSSVFLMLAVYMLTRLTKAFYPGIDPALPAVFLLLYPTAFFLNAVYTESLFLFLSLATVYYALRRNFLSASAWAALASATRVSGLFLCVLLATEFVQEHGWRAVLSRRVLPLALAPAGIIVFFLYQWIAFGDFFLFLKVETAFGRDFTIAVSNYFTIRNSADLAHTLLDLSYTVAVILMAFIAIKRLRLSYGLYMIVSVAVVLASGTPLGIARYAMVFFPIYLIGAGIRSTLGRSAWLFASTLLQALNTIRFVNHYWAG
jgi:hypothetical protein